MTTLTFNDLIDSLESLTDRQLESLNGAIIDVTRTRRKAQGRKMAAELSIGSKVRIGSRAKPQYLQLQTGVVESMGPQRVTIKLDKGPMGKFRTGRVICPPSMLELVK